MSNELLHQLNKINSVELLPGFHGKMIHTENMTLAFWEIKKDSELPLHQHVHEQVATMLEGKFELILDGISHILEPGQVLEIPSGVPHSGRALTECKILDVFSPVREDYK
jgi:quercetin dioxygenase-like cupin family protein